MRVKERLSSCLRLSAKDCARGSRSDPPGEEWVYWCEKKMDGWRPMPCECAGEKHEMRIDWTAYPHETFVRIETFN